MTTSTKPRAARMWMMVAPLALLIVAAGLWTFTRSSASDRPLTTGDVAVDPSLARIAVQQGDLPPGFRRCDISGDIETYMARMKEASPSVYPELVSVWEQLRSHGAIAGYAAFWGDNTDSCESIVDPSAASPKHAAGRHVTTAFSIVVRFASADAAASAYTAEIFRQSDLKGAPGYEVREGPASGLGPNSLTGAATHGDGPLYQAVWQTGTVNVLLGTENLPVAKAAQVAAAVDHRID